MAIQPTHLINTSWGQTLCLGGLPSFVSGSGSRREGSLKSHHCTHTRTNTPKTQTYLRFRLHSKTRTRCVVGCAATGPSAATNTIPRLHPMAMPPHHNTAENCTPTANARSGKFVSTGAVSSAVSARKVLKTLGGGWWAKQPGETEGAIAAPTDSPPVCALGWLAGGCDGGQRRAYRAAIEGLPGSCWRRGAGCCGRARWHGRQACPPPRRRSTW